MLSGFKEYFNESLGRDVSGLITVRPYGKVGKPMGRPQVNVPNSFKDRAGVLVNRMVTVLPMTIIRGLVDFAFMLKNMGFTGDPDPGGVLKKVGKMAWPAVVYTAASLLGMPAAPLVAILASKQFWDAWSKSKEMHKQGSIKPLFGESDVSFV
jgi:hypothetical protein